MQKVYLILRNNKQEGPYDLQELLQLPVKDTDLIWVEGRSAAWSYPSEVRDLKPYFSSSTTDAITNHSVKSSDQHERSTPNSSSNKANHIFVSFPHQTTVSHEAKEITPEEALDLKAEALRQKLQAYQNTHAEKESEMIQTKLQRSLDDVAGDYADWAIRSKAKNKKSVPLKPLLLSAFILLTVVTAWTLFSPDTTTQKKAQESAPLSEDQITTTIVEPTIVAPTDQITPDLNIPKEEILISNVKKNSIINSTIKKETILAGTTPEDTPVQNEPLLESQLPVVDKGEVDEPVAIEEKKKKSFGEAIDGFFDKFKSKKGEEGKAPAPTGTERKATKRGEISAEEAVTVDVSDEVKISSNKPSEDWMLGVKGLKLTLQNQSSVVIANALVEVQYFGEDETLLDKKLIEFKNIKPKEKSTVPVPDHRLASHTSHKILSATGITNN